MIIRSPPISNTETELSQRSAINVSKYVMKVTLEAVAKKSELEE